MNQGSSYSDVFAQKKSVSSRWRFWLWAGILCVVLAIIIASLYFLIYSEVLVVNKFTFRGSDLVSKERVLSVLSQEMISNNFWRAILGPGNILFWQLGKRPDRLASLALLENLKINADLFTKEVVVEAKTRELLGVLCVQDNKCYGFDKEGMIFIEVPKIEGVLILKIEDLNQRPIILGRPIFSSSEWFNNIFSVLENLKNNKWLIASVKIKNSAFKEWEAELATGTLLYFNMNFVPENLGGILENLNRRLKLEELKYIDLRVQNRIYYK